ncbi:Segregation and condensation protein B [subsurface metagenome]
MEEENNKNNELEPDKSSDESLEEDEVELIDESTEEEVKPIDESLEEDEVELIDESIVEDKIESIDESTAEDEIELIDKSLGEDEVESTDESSTEEEVKPIDEFLIKEEINRVEPEIQELSDEERKERLDLNFHKNQIEAALFVAGRPLGLEELSSKLEIKQDLIKNIINELAFEFLDRTTAIEIVQIGDKYSMQIKPEYSEKVARFAAGGLIPQRIMRTLTIIALKQPILKSKLIKIRGSGAYEHVKWLLDNEFINAIKKGRTHELTTNQKFAETFGFSTNVEEMKKQIISQLEGEQ